MRPRNEGEIGPKVLALKIALVCLFAVFAGRLIYLQVVRGDYYRLLSANNYTRNIVLRAPRGMILDRNGAVLCRNRVSFSLLFDATRSGDTAETLQNMDRLLGIQMSKEELKAAMKRSPVSTLAVVARDIPPRVVQRVESRQEELPHLTIEMEMRRDYPNGPVLGHSLGYVGLISPEESKSMNIPITDPFIEVGKAGVERTSNARLMGRNGRRTAQVNSLGREVNDPTLRIPGVGLTEDATPGASLRLNLDFKLQRLLHAAFGGETGTAIFMDPNTGEILSWVSVPGFDPNLFTGTVSAADWNALRDDPNHPLLNRPIQGAYPAGSSFKPFVALVGLEEGKVSPSTVYSCPGVWVFGGNPFHCWSKGGHGGVDVLTAIQNSCNVFFYKAGDAIGIDRLAKWGARFGLGRPTGIDLPSEGSGILPSPQWKASRNLGPWYPGETLPVSIGQGYLTVTPMQLLAFYGTLATGGTQMRPHLAEAPPEVVERTPISASSLAIVKEGLARVVSSGTGKACRLDGIEVCAKTGTAQVVKASSGKNTYSLEKAQRDHGWFAGFAPRENPTVAFVILVEHGGHGGDMAAKIAKIGLEYLLQGKEPEPAAVPATPAPKTPKPPEEVADSPQDVARLFDHGEGALHVH